MYSAQKDLDKIWYSKTLCNTLIEKIPRENVVRLYCRIQVQSLGNTSKIATPHFTEFPQMPATIRLTSILERRTKNPLPGKYPEELAELPMNITENSHWSRSIFRTWKNWRNSSRTCWSSDGGVSCVRWYVRVSVCAKRCRQIDQKWTRARASAASLNSQMGRGNVYPPSLPFFFLCGAVGALLGVRRRRLEEGIGCGGPPAPSIEDRHGEALFVSRRAGCIMSSENRSFRGSWTRKLKDAGHFHPFYLWNCYWSVLAVQTNFFWTKLISVFLGIVVKYLNYIWWIWTLSNLFFWRFIVKWIW